MDTALIYTYTVYGLIVLIYVTAVFLIAQLKADNSVMDIFYGPAYAVAYWVTWSLTGGPDGLPLIVGALVTLWAARLSLRILRKNWGKPEDPRYAKWRREWSARSALYFTVRSYLQVNLLQGLIICIVAAPLVWVIALGSVPGLVTLLGVAIVLAGLAIEATADYQLDRFIAGKRAGTETRELMTDGLFRYSRRPNYFGESLIWWGFSVIALPLSAGYLVLVSALLITYILTKVTGPMLEAQFLERYPEAYRAYMARTNYFIPGRPKKTP
jgi:steroid 5-alpha reductase family enzyme